MSNENRAKPRIMVKLSFRELCDSKLLDLCTFDPFIESIEVKTEK